MITRIKKTQMSFVGLFLEHIEIFHPPN